MPDEGRGLSDQMLADRPYSMNSQLNTKTQGWIRTNIPHSRQQEVTVLAANHVPCTSKSLHVFDFQQPWEGGTVLRIMSLNSRGYSRESKELAPCHLAKVAKPWFDPRHICWSNTVLEKPHRTVVRGIGTPPGAQLGPPPRGWVAWAGCNTSSLSPSCALNLVSA